jgi:hypothetical protein
MFNSIIRDVSFFGYCGHHKISGGSSNLLMKNAQTNLFSVQSLLNGVHRVIMLYFVNFRYDTSIFLFL